MNLVVSHIKLKRRRRIAFLTIALFILTASIALIAAALEDSITFFYTPSELFQKNVSSLENIRIGGMVVANSVAYGENGNIQFQVTDQQTSLSVVFEGIPPDLFAEGQGVIAEGTLTSQGVFIARRILAKHDENYMPPSAETNLSPQ